MTDILEQKFKCTQYLFDFYKQVIAIFLKCKNKNGISELTQKDIAVQLGVSQTVISKEYQT